MGAAASAVLNKSDWLGENEIGFGGSWESELTDICTVNCQTLDGFCEFAANHRSRDPRGIQI